MLSRQFEIGKIQGKIEIGSAIYSHFKLTFANEIDLCNVRFVFGFSLSSNG